MDASTVDMFGEVFLVRRIALDHDIYTNRLCLFNCLFIYLFIYCVYLSEMMIQRYVFSYVNPPNSGEFSSVEFKLFI